MIYHKQQKLAGLKFIKTAIKSVRKKKVRICWQKEVRQIHLELQVCIDIRMICEKTAQFAKFAKF